MKISFHITASLYLSVERHIVVRRFSDETSSYLSIDIQGRKIIHNYQAEEDRVTPQRENLDI